MGRIIYLIIFIFKNTMIGCVSYFEGLDIRRETFIIVLLSIQISNLHVRILLDRMYDFACSGTDE